MARPDHFNGGKVIVFPTHVEESVLDIEEINRLIEADEEGIARLTEHRDMLQEMAYERTRALKGDAESHGTAISGQVTSLCRTGVRSDPSVIELRKVAKRRLAERKALGCIGCARCQSEGPEAA